MTKKYPEYIALYHTVRGPDMDTLGVSIHIMKPRVELKNGKEETVGEWKLHSFQNHETGKIYTPSADKVMTRKVLQIVNSELQLDAEQVYYDAIAAMYPGGESY